MLYAMEVLTVKRDGSIVLTRHRASRYIKLAKVDAGLMADLLFDDEYQSQPSLGCKGTNIYFGKNMFSEGVTVRVVTVSKKHQAGTYKVG